MIHTLNLVMNISFHEAIALSDALSEQCKKDGARFYIDKYGTKKEEVVKVAELFRHKGLVIKICKSDQTKYACIDLRLNPIKLVNANATIETTKEYDLKNIEEAFELLMTPVYKLSLEKLVTKGVIVSGNDLSMVKGRKGEVADITDLSSYLVKRIDYCIDVHTQLSSRYMELIRRGDVPSKFEMKMNVDPNSGKRSRYKDSMYLYTRSRDIKINFYNKEKEMEGNEYYSLKEKSEASNILRFEVQCARTKVNNMKAKYGFDSKVFKEFVFNQLAIETINDYYIAVADKSDYVTLKVARDIVLVSNLFSKQDKKTIIEVLELISEKRSVYIARKTYATEFQRSSSAEKRFNRVLRQVRCLNINPVTIPVNWGIERLSNLHEQIIRAGALPDQAVVTFGLDERLWS